MTANIIRQTSEWSGTFLSIKPIVKALLIAIILTWIIVRIAGVDGTNTEAIYSGVFDLVALFSGFLATFYVFIATRGNRFLRKIQHTNTFKMMLHLLRFTILWSVGLIGFSYILMVLNIKEFEFPSVEVALVYFWVFNITLIVTNFVRCVLQFMMVTDLEANKSDE